MSGLYDYRWQKARKVFLQQHPLCAMCLRIGKTTQATVVDHIIPHKGDYVLFWDADNWQSLCKLCHDAHKQSYERTGKLRGCDLQGQPLDPNHHWNRT